MNDIEQTLKKMQALARPAEEVVRLDKEEAVRRSEQLRVLILAASNMPRRHGVVVVSGEGKYASWHKRKEWLFDRLGTGMFVALVGARGNGKTQMAVEMMKRSAELGRKCYFCTPAGFFLALKATYGRNDGPTEEDVVNRFATWKLLVLDEIGQRGESDWEDRVLFEMLNRRYNSGVDTMLLGNDGKAKTEESLGPSLASRMVERGGIIECTWPSFRQ